MNYLFLLMFLINSFGCSNWQMRPTKSRKVPPFLYSLSKNDQTWYLFGTHHYLGVEELPIVVLEKFKNSKTFVTESTSAVKYFSEREDVLYRKPVEQQPSDRSKKALLERGISAEIISKASLGALCKLYYWGPQRPISMDSSFEEYGHTQQKKTITLDDPIRIQKVTKSDFNECDLEVMTLKSPEEIQKGLQSGIDEYRSGDPKFYEYEEIFNEAKERNFHWFKILKQLDDKNVFIAVGVSHLYGQTGLLKFFEDENFQIKRILE